MTISIHRYIKHICVKCGCWDMALWMLVHRKMASRQWHPAENVRYLHSSLISLIYVSDDMATNIHAAYTLMMVMKIISNHFMTSYWYKTISKRQYIFVSTTPWYLLADKHFKRIRHAMYLITCMIRKKPCMQVVKNMSFHHICKAWSLISNVTRCNRPISSPSSSLEHYILIFRICHHCLLKNTVTPNFFIIIIIIIINK